MIPFTLIFIYSIVSRHQFDLDYMILDYIPHLLARIELRRIDGESRCVEAFLVYMETVFHVDTSVRTVDFSQQHYAAAYHIQKIFQKFHDLCAGNVIDAYFEIEFRVNAHGEMSGNLFHSPIHPHDMSGTGADNTALRVQ